MSDKLKVEAVNLTTKARAIQKIEAEKKNIEKKEEITPQIPSLKLTRADFSHLMKNRPLIKYRPFKNSFTKKGDKIMLANGLEIPVNEVDDYIERVIAQEIIRFDEAQEERERKLAEADNEKLALVEKYILRHGTKKQMLKFVEHEMANQKLILKKLYKILDQNVGDLFAYFERPCHLLDNRTAVKMYKIINRGLDDAQKAGFIEEDANIEASKWALKQIYLIQSNYKFINAVKFFRYGERPY